MKCVICKHGETHAGFVTVTLERDESIVIIKRVPAENCDNCGEYSLRNVITYQVLLNTVQDLFSTPSVLRESDTHL